MAQEQSVFKYSLIEVAIVSAVLIGANIFFYSANNGSQVATKTTNVNAPIQVATNTKMDNTRMQPANMAKSVSNARDSSNTSLPTATPNDFNDQICELKNYDGSTTNLRIDCDTRSCEQNASTKIGSYPNGTKIKVSDSNAVSGYKFNWKKIKIVDSGQEGWVADSKISCAR